MGTGGASKYGGTLLCNAEIAADIPQPARIFSEALGQRQPSDRLRESTRSRAKDVAGAGLPGKNVILALRIQILTIPE